MLVGNPEADRTERPCPEIKMADFATTIFTVRLDDDGSCIEEVKILFIQYFRLPPPVESNPYKLRLVITSGSSASISPLLHTNIPFKSQKFQRDEFNNIHFNQMGSDLSIELDISNAGTFRFYVTFGSDKDRQTCKKPGKFVVDPRLTFHKTASASLLALDGITILTIIPKWMPTVDLWMPFFQQFAETGLLFHLTLGYNMVHFAPVNKRGVSNSPYSIKNQLSISDDLFPSVISEKEKDKQLQGLIECIHKEFHIFSVTDIVWNHTSCDSEWLQDHPEAGYNLKNSPHLRPAYELDEAMLEYSASLEHDHINPKSQAELDKVIGDFRNGSFASLKLYEFYVLDVKDQTTQFSKAWKKSTESKDIPDDYLDLKNMSFKERVVLLSSKALRDPKTYLRFSKYLDMEIVVAFVQAVCRAFNITNPDNQLGEFEQILNEINLEFYKEYDEDVAVIFEQIKNRSKYIRLDAHGPKLGSISRENPIVDSYFTRLPKNEKTKALNPDEMMLACNGWIWNADPLVNFAGEGSKSYLRREVIAWGDCVKLRYGNGYEDNPWLWQHQTDYTLKMANLFHGFRIDNCHSTPIHVAAFLLDKARNLRPDLYVFAELFTGSEKTDILFVSELGINSLIREAMNAWDPKELSRLVHRQGGSPVGSFTLQPDQFPLDMLGHDIGSQYRAMDSKGEFLIYVKRSLPHSLFMDCTHDNETPHQKRTSADTLSTAGLVAMSACGIGSVKGYDEIIPKLLDVVGETRKYRLPNTKDGIVKVKSVLNPLHAHMATNCYSEIHVNQEGGYISVHRMHPITNDGYLLVARTAFNNQPSDHGNCELTSSSFAYKVEKPTC
jgi:glycogen debranching enzyme